MCWLPMLEPIAIDAHGFLGWIDRTLGKLPGRRRVRCTPHHRSSSLRRFSGYRLWSADLPWTRAVPALTGWLAFIAFGTAFFGGRWRGLVASTFHLGTPRTCAAGVHTVALQLAVARGLAGVRGADYHGPLRCRGCFVRSADCTAGLGGAQHFVWRQSARHSMMYGQLKTVPRWRHWTTPLLFFAYGLGRRGAAGGTNCGRDCADRAGRCACRCWPGISATRHWPLPARTQARPPASGREGEVRAFESPTHRPELS